ncbi:MAG TPA: RidA family protein [Rhizomicrobium sp.]|jgi:enamine deaminase RidA (YjgF/YER057c/UK114 family)|nr:RidA family protein [Rhizomicrobium sp.]
MSKIEQRLTGLGIELPSPPAPVASYVPYTISGNLVVISGQIPIIDGKPRFVGKLGADISIEDGKKAAQLCALNLIAQLKAACGGNLDRVKGCLRLGVFVNATADFTQHPEIANGASDFMVEAMGEAGKHARAAVGASSLPRGVAVEVEGLFEIS